MDIPKRKILPPMNEILIGITGDPAPVSGSGDKRTWPICNGWNSPRCLEPD